jgi:hypothetical protein
MKAIILLSIMTFLLISCDGNRSGSGIIRDKVTSQPIDKVKYFSLHDDQSVSFTDVKGEYYVYGPIGGCTPNCIDFDAEYSKAGYKTLIIRNPDGDIFLEKE